MGLFSKLTGSGFAGANVINLSGGQLGEDQMAKLRMLQGALTEVELQAQKRRILADT